MTTAEQITERATLIKINSAVGQPAGLIPAIYEAYLRVWPGSYLTQRAARSVPSRSVYDSFRAAGINAAYRAGNALVKESDDDELVPSICGIGITPILMEATDSWHLFFAVAAGKGPSQVAVAYTQGIPIPDANFDLPARAVVAGQKTVDEAIDYIIGPYPDKMAHFDASGRIAALTDGLQTDRKFFYEALKMAFMPLR